MKALRFESFGPPDVLRLEEIPTPVSDVSTAVVAVRAASINPSDVGNVAGRFPDTTLPRTPGRDYSGVVVDGPSEWIGQDVWGAGDGGFSRDGSHGEYIAVPVASLRRKPSTLTHEQAASIGVSFSAAWIGTVEYARLQPGETLLVIGAAGSVGGAAAQIGMRIGARVIGLDRRSPLPDSPVTEIAEPFIVAQPEEIISLIREATGGKGVDVVLNAIGGATFEPSLATLSHRGRLAILASPGERRQTFDLVDYYHNESQLFGVDTLKRDMIASASVLEAMTPAFEEGAFRAAMIRETAPLDKGVDAYRSVASGKAGRVVLIPT